MCQGSARGDRITLTRWWAGEHTGAADRASWATAAGRRCVGARWRTRPGRKPRHNSQSALVGYTGRFNVRTGPNPRVTLITDGIRLMALERDRSLRRCDTLIIDEAHERSLNIDLLLGVLKQTRATPA